MNKNEKIRKRKSYQFWKELKEFLELNPPISDVLMKFYAILDKRQAFKSETNAFYNAESLELLLKE